MQRKATTLATSSGSPTRPRGVVARIFCSRSGSFSTGSASGVRMYHGATALTRMPSLAHSAARPTVSCVTAAGVLGAIDRTKYDVVPVGITTGGRLQPFEGLVERLTADFRHRVRPGAVRVRRIDRGVEVLDAAGNADQFDEVVLACHADDALGLLDDADETERAILGAVRFRAADVVLHRDPALMPRSHDAWAAWTILNRPGPEGGPAVTYWMNALQGIDSATPLFVSLDPPRPPAPELTLGRGRLSHPQFDRAAIAAQARLGEVQGVRRTWLCGAWTGYGFHEDGVRSGLDVAQALGAHVPWRAGSRARAAA